MMAEQIAYVIEELQVATDLLFTNTNRVNLDRMEVAVAAREQAIRTLHELVSHHPNSFTPEHLARVRAIHARGKLALEQLVETRREGWITATELGQGDYTFKSVSRFGSPSSKS